MAENFKDFPCQDRFYERAGKGKKDSPEFEKGFEKGMGGNAGPPRFLAGLALFMAPACCGSDPYTGSEGTTDPPEKVPLHRGIDSAGEINGLACVREAAPDLAP